MSDRLHNRPQMILRSLGDDYHPLSIDLSGLPKLDKGQSWKLEVRVMIVDGEPVAELMMMERVFEYEEDD